MNNHFGIPGIGGSLGTCALCGEAFIMEIMLGKAVRGFNVGGCNQTLYGHDKCLKPLEQGKLDVLTLPPASPLRQAFFRNNPEPTGQEVCDA